MATTVDERIVAAKFDASDFEKGVNKTVKKLDELKKSLDLKKETGKIGEVTEKMKDSAESMSKSLGTLSERLTTFSGMIKQRILGGLADQVAGVFLKMQQSVTGFVRSISSDQIGAGMSKYEQMLTSVRVMMSSGESEDASYKAIQRLQEYSDETSYSLSQMTDAMSKMRAAGVKLDDAAKNVEGIANACANAGINATDASRAFFNLSQAYSSGVLKYTDYRSLELLNLTTSEFKNAMLESAEAAGTLKKIGDGVWQTINKNDKKVKAGKKITEKNLSDMLKYNFMNTAAMNNLFGGKYWMEVIGREELEQTKAEFKKLYGDNWETELKKKYGDLAVTAYEAAKEARSFTDVINALKDAVSSGWSNSFQHLFGKLSEAKEFFTDLSNGALADVIYNIGEYRNAILGYWNETDALGRGSGGELFRQSILNITEALGTLFDTFLQVLPGFDELGESEEDGQAKLKAIGHKMFELSMRIRDVTENIKKAAEEFRSFMTAKVFDDGSSRIDKIRNTLANLSATLSIIAKVAGMAFNAIGKAFYVLQPVFDGFLNLMEKITQPIVDLKENTQFFSDIDSAITNILNILRPIADVLGKIINFLGDVGAFIASMALDTFVSNIQFVANAIGFFMELFTKNSAEMEKGEGILDRIRKDFESIKSACREGLTALKGFFDALIGDIRTLFGLTDGKDNQNGGVFSGIINFFNTNEFVKKAKAWVTQAIADVGNFIKSIPARLKKFGANIYDTLRGLFFTKQDSGNGEAQEVLTPLGQWLSDTIQNIKKFIVSIPDRIVDGIGKIGNWIDTVFNYFFNPETANAEGSYIKDENGNWIKQSADKITTKFDEFIQNARTQILAWFDDLPNKIQALLKGIGSFFTRVINAIDQFLFGKKVGTTITAMDKNGKTYTKSITTRYKTGFSKWLDTMITEIKKFLLNIPNYIKAGIKGAGDILSTIVQAIFGTKGDKEPTSSDVEARLKKPFEGLSLSGILNTIKEIGTTLLNEIARIFTGTDDIEKNQEWFSNLIANGITWIKTKAMEALKAVLEFLSSLPTRIAALFRGETDTSTETNPIGKSLMEFGSAIGKFLTEDLPTAVLTFVENAATEFGKIWDQFYKSIIGDADNASENAQKDALVRADAADVGTPTVSGWQKFVARLGETIAHIWEQLPTWIAEGIDMAIMAIGKIIDNLGNWIHGLGENKDTSDAAQEMMTGALMTIANSSKEGAKEEEPKLVTALKGIGERIKTLFVEIIPGFIHEAWTAIAGLGSKIWEGFSQIFNAAFPTGEGDEGGLSVGKIISTVSTFLTQTLPGKFSDIWKEVSTLGSAIWDGLSAVFDSDVPEEEKQSAVQRAGEAIRDFFVEKLPAFIKEAWGTISKFATDVFEGFSAIFTGKIPESEVGRAVAEFGIMVKNFITTTIPEKIKEAFDWIGKQFSGNSDGGGVDKAAGAITEYVAYGQWKTNEEIKKHAQKPGIWTFIESVKDGLIKAVTSVGPMILEGMAAAFNFLGDIAQIIIDALTGGKGIADAVSDRFKEQSPNLRNALVKIGESLKRFFLDILPEFLGSAIGTIVGESGKWFGKLFSGLNKSMAEAGKEQQQVQENSENTSDTMKAAEGALSSVMSFMDKLKGIGDAAAAVFVIFGLVALVRAVHSLLSVSDELDSVSSVLKWGTIAIAVSGLVGILSTISGLVASGSEKDIQNAKDIITMLGDLLTKVEWIVGFMAGKSLVGMIGDIWGGKAGDGKKAEKGVKDSNKLLSILTEGAGAFMKFLGIEGAVAAGQTVLGGTFETLTDSIVSSFQSMAAGLTSFMDLINPLVNQLADMNGTVNTAIATVTNLKFLFEKLYNVFSDVYDEATGLNTNRFWTMTVGMPGGQQTHYSEFGRMMDGATEAESSIKAFTEDMTHRIEFFTKLAFFIEKMVSAFRQMQEIGDIRKEIGRLADQEFLGDLTTLMTNLFNAMNEAFFQSESVGWIGSMDKDRLSMLSDGLEIMANALAVFSTSISGISGESVNALDRTLEVFRKLANSLGKIEFDDSFFSKLIHGNNSLSKVGEQVQLFGSYMKSFYNYIDAIKGFDSASAKETEAKVDSVVKVAVGMAKAIGEMEGDVQKKLEDLGRGLPGMGDAISDFLLRLDRGLGTNISTDRISILSQMMESLGELGSIFAILSHGTIPGVTLADEIFASYEESNGKLSATLFNFIDQVGNAFISLEAKEKFNASGKSVAGFLAEGIKLAFDTDPTLRPEIRPVLNMEDAAKQLKDFFGMDNNGNVDVTALLDNVNAANPEDRSRVTPEYLDLKIKTLSDILNVINENVNTNVDNLSKAISSISIVMNTGALVGAIADDVDAAIGQKMWTNNRGVALPTGP